VIFHDVNELIPSPQPFHALSQSTVSATPQQQHDFDGLLTCFQEFDDFGMVEFRFLASFFLRHHNITSSKNGNTLVFEYFLSSCLVFVRFSR
jgi:hypothetical protein